MNSTYTSKADKILECNMLMEWVKTESSVFDIGYLNWRYYVSDGILYFKSISGNWSIYKEINKNDDFGKIAHFKFKICISHFPELIFLHYIIFFVVSKYF